MSPHFPRHWNTLESESESESTPVPPLMTIYGTMYVPNYAKIGGKIRGRTRIREIRVFKKKGVFFRPKL